MTSRLDDAVSRMMSVSTDVFHQSGSVCTVLTIVGRDDSLTMLGGGWGLDFVAQRAGMHHGVVLLPVSIADTEPALLTRLLTLHHASEVMYSWQDNQLIGAPDSCPVLAVVGVDAATCRARESFTVMHSHSDDPMQVLPSNDVLAAFPDGTTISRWLGSLVPSASS